MITLDDFGAVAQIPSAKHSICSSNVASCSLAGISSKAFVKRNVIFTCVVPLLIFVRPVYWNSSIYSYNILSSLALPCLRE